MDVDGHYFQCLATMATLLERRSGLALPFIHYDRANPTTLGRAKIDGAHG
jgi:hypothetical protein